MRLEFNGELTFGDDYYRSSSEGINGSIFIGGVDVIDSIREEKIDNVKVYFYDVLIAEGCCTTSLGWGYSSWTPMDQDECKINDFDLIGFFQDKTIGQKVNLIITDEE